MVGAAVRRRIGPKGEVVVPKVFRESLGIKPGDEILMEMREGELSIRRAEDPGRFVEDFCSISKRKLTRKIDLKKILEEEVKERVALH
jgi:AbrB family looped-hinge helix DNA binding protein